jgi:hypothetical protein
MVRMPRDWSTPAHSTEAWARIGKASAHARTEWRRHFGHECRIVKVAEVGEVVSRRGRPQVGIRDKGLKCLRIVATRGLAVLLIIGREAKSV